MITKLSFAFKIRLWFFALFYWKGVLLLQKKDLSNVLFFLSTSIKYFHFPALCWWNLYQLYTSGTRLLLINTWLQRCSGEVDLYCTQRVRGCRQLDRVHRRFLHPLLFQVNIPVVLCSDIVSQNIVDHPQLSYRATWAVLPWTIVVLAWISLLPRIASIKVYCFYKWKI